MSLTGDARPTSIAMLVIPVPWLFAVLHTYLRRRFDLPEVRAVFTIPLSALLFYFLYMWFTAIAYDGMLSIG